MKNLNETFSTREWYILEEAKKKMRKQYGAKLTWRELLLLWAEGSR